MQAMGYKRRYDSDDEAERDMGYDLLGFQREAAWPVVVLFETGETCRKPNPNRVEACQAMPNQNHVKCQESHRSSFVFFVEAGTSKWTKTKFDILWRFINLNSKVKICTKLRKNGMYIGLK